MTAPNLKKADCWKLRTKTLSFGKMPLLMGILNVTPDSFSDGGKFFDAQKAVQHGLKMIREGADLVDVGGQSTRPGAEPITEEEELRRVMPVLEELCCQSPVPISVDTFQPLVATEALQAGVEIINDITGFINPQMLKLAAESACGLCAMHMQGTPQTMQDHPQYDDVVDDVLEFLRQRRDALVAAGVDPAAIAIDPGIGFGKTSDHNVALLSNAWRFHSLGCPILIGHSRKRFIGQISDMPNADPLPGTIGASLALALQGVQILRVHDIQALRQAFILFEACGGY
ncbi:MAG: dihydropteroate synthase [Thermoguttaceae bacterium]